MYIYLVSVMIQPEVRSGCVFFCYPSASPIPVSRDTMWEIDVCVRVCVCSFIKQISKSKKTVQNYL